MEEVGIERKETKGTRPNDVVSNLLSSSRGEESKKKTRMERIAETSRRTNGDKTRLG